MKVGFLQTLPIFGKKDKNVDNTVALIKKLDANLIVLPELFNTGYQFISKSETLSLAEKIPEGETIRALIDIAKEKKLFIVAGIAEREDKHCYNSAVLVGHNGFIGCYRKLHLFRDEKKWFEPGSKGPGVFDIGNAKVGMMICFDWFFPEVARYLALKGADIICHPANLILPYCPQAMVTRCIENRVFAITANRVGIEKRSEELLTFIGTSQILGTKGEILCRASIDKEDAMVVEIDPGSARDKQITPLNHIFNDRQIKFVSNE